MNNTWKPDSECDSAEEYVAPEIQTYSPADFVSLLGPAQGYGGTGGGGGGGGARSTGGRGYRLYPGLR